MRFPAPCIFWKLWHTWTNQEPARDDGARGPFPSKVGQSRRGTGNYVTSRDDGPELRDAAAGSDVPLTS